MFAQALGCSGDLPSLLLRQKNSRGEGAIALTSQGNQGNQKVNQGNPFTSKSRKLSHLSDSEECERFSQFCSGLVRSTLPPQPPFRVLARDTWRCSFRLAGYPGDLVCSSMILRHILGDPRSGMLGTLDILCSFMILRHLLGVARSGWWVPWRSS